MSGNECEMTEMRGTCRKGCLAARMQQLSRTTYLRCDCLPACLPACFDQGRSDNDGAESRCLQMRGERVLAFASPHPPRSMEMKFEGQPAPCTSVCTFITS